MCDEIEDEEGEEEVFQIVEIIVGEGTEMEGGRSKRVGSRPEQNCDSDNFFNRYGVL